MHIAPVVLAVLSLAAEPPRTGSPKGQEVILPTDIKWVDGPASLPPGAKMAVLDGDPAKDGPFVLRIKLPDGFRIAPHTHPKDERVTVLEGTLHLGMGAKFNTKAAHALPAGAFGVTRAGEPHFGWVTGDTVLQLNGTGPWAVDYLDPRDDPRNKK